MLNNYLFFYIHFFIKNIKNDFYIFKLFYLMIILYYIT